MKIQSLEGQIFGRLTVMQKVGPAISSGGVLWKCQCSCGNITNVRAGNLTRIKNNTNSCGCLRIESSRRNGLSLPHGKGSDHPNWKDGWEDTRGYRLHSVNGKHKLDHITIAEKAMGRPLRVGEVVHHINGIKKDNHNSNLLICTQSYHRTIEERMIKLYQKKFFTKGEITSDF
jgi:hypothetical protein